MILDPNQLGRTWTHVALDTRVLAIAVRGEVDDWAAYIGAIPGHNHTEEAEIVAEKGTKLPYNIAKVIFPTFDDRYTWRP